MREGYLKGNRSVEHCCRFENARLRLAEGRAVRRDQLKGLKDMMHGNTPLGNSKRKTTLRRVQLDLSPTAFERLSRLKLDTEASTYSEVIRSALKLYAVAVEQRETGSELIVRRPDGSEVLPLI